MINKLAQWLTPLGFFVINKIKEKIVNPGSPQSPKIG
jgi:hypothetical protein